MYWPPGHPFSMLSLPPYQLLIFLCSPVIFFVLSCIFSYSFFKQKESIFNYSVKADIRQ